MKHSRGPWYLFTGLLVGLAMGLGYAWFIDPIEYSNAAPQALRAAYKDQYRSLIARSYQANRDLGRTLGRLALLKDGDISQALNVQAQRILARDGDEDEARALAELAAALEGKAVAALATQLAEGSAVQRPAAEETPTSIPSPEGLEEAEGPIKTKAPTASPQPTFTPRATASPRPGFAVAFVFVGAEEICDPELPPGLLQVYIADRAGEGMPGVRLQVTWEGGEEHFFTGLYPQFSPGYADFVAAPEKMYTLHAGENGEPIRDLAAPECTRGEQTFTGGLLLRFTEP